MRVRTYYTIAGALVCAALCAGRVEVSASAEPQGTRELVILNWADYLDPELVAEFERGHDVRIK